MKNSIIERNALKAQYSKLQNYENEVLVPIWGNYFIKEINYRTIDEFQIVPIATVIWNHTQFDFLEGTEFEIQPLILFNEGSEGPKEMDLEDLVGKVISINVIGYYNPDHVKNSSETCFAYWCVALNRVKTIPQTDAIISFLSGDDECLSDFMEEFNKSVPESTLAFMNQNGNDCKLPCNCSLPIFKTPLI